MRLPESVEWALHCVGTLAHLDPGHCATAGMLAEFYDLPGAYLAKQLQALTRAGVLVANTGPRGGFRLARSADRITLLDVVEAIDGAAPPYQCNEIRRRGRGALTPDECATRCLLAGKMAQAHHAWRDSLAATTLADVATATPPEQIERTRAILAR